MTDHATTQAHREARLRPEHAHRYPGCPAGEWLPASIAAAYVMGHREVLLGQAQARTERALKPGEWEFRGENLFAKMDPAQRRRFTDRHTSGAYAVVTQADEALSAEPGSTLPSD